MKKAILLLLVLIIALGAGCVSQVPNRDITVTSPDIDHPERTNIGSVDMYTPQFRIINPSNQTHTNIVVKIEVAPLLTYCHPATKTIEITALHPKEKRVEQVPITEFSDIDCQYSFTYTVVSDP
mgnify:CR=1 FL=1